MNDEYVDENGKAKEINQYLDFMLTDKHEKSARKTEAYLLNNPEFKKTIEQARDEIGVVGTESGEDFAALEYISIGVTGGDTNKSPEVVRKMYEETISKILSEFKLPSSWRDYIGVYLVHNKPPLENLLSNLDKIRALEVTDHGEVTLKLKPGLRREDYVNAWKVFAPFLGPAASLEKALSDPGTDAKMSLDKDSGFTYKKLAKKYFPKHFENNELDTIEMVKKRVQRYRKRYMRDKTNEAS